MTKKTPSAEKTDRAVRDDRLGDALNLIRVLKAIPVRHPAASAEILERLEKEGTPIRLRTLQRILAVVREHPELFSVRAEAEGKTIRYQWDPAGPGFHLPELPPATRLLLRLAEAHLRREMPAAALTGLRLLFRSTPKRKKAKRDPEDSALLGRVKVLTRTIAPSPAPVKALVFERIAEALSARKILSLRHKLANGRFHEERLAPLGIVQRDGRTWLLAQGSSAGEPSAIALDRIDSARVTTFDASENSDFDIEDAARKEPFAPKGPSPRTIRLRFETDSRAFAEELAAVPLDRTQTIERLPRESPEDPVLWRVTMETEDSPLLDAWIARRQHEILRLAKAPAGSDKEEAAGSESPPKEPAA